MNKCCEPLNDLESKGTTDMYKGNDLEFQSHAIEIEKFNYHHWIS